ncbi:hypothetical protein C6341_g26788 [Phytophthora cactorum]|nr:hypothetical protein C6341_g26788 [Phytophthora cactorum]
MSASQQERTRARDRERELALDSGNVPVKFNNLSVIAIALIKKSAGQVKHRNKAEEGEGAIVFGTSDNWKKKPKKNRKCAKSRIVFVTKKVEP